MLGTASAGAPDPAARAKAAAQKIYVQGTAHFKAGRLLEALAAFRASYEIVPSANSHLMIARTLREHGDLADSFVEYDKVIPEAASAAERDAKYASTAVASRSERDDLRRRIAMLTIMVKSPPADLRVLAGDRPIERSAWGMAFPVAPRLAGRARRYERTERATSRSGGPGGGALVATLDYGPAAQAEEILPSPFPTEHSDSERNPPRRRHWANQHLTFRGSRASPARRPDRTWAYVSLGVGAAGFATFAVFGLLNETTYNDLKQSCINAHCSPQRIDDVERGQREQVIANVALGVSAVATTLGLVLFASAGNEAAPHGRRRLGASPGSTAGLGSTHRRGRGAQLTHPEGRILKLAQVTAIGCLFLGALSACTNDYGVFDFPEGRAEARCGRRAS